VFAQIELHLQRSIIDPLDDTSHMMAYAEQRAAELEGYIQKLSAGADVAAVGDSPGVAAINETQHLVQDADIPPQFKEVFIEESEEIVAELTSLSAQWAQQPEASEVLRDIRRHFHTFKGNGRAVGANILGELGWAAQDMLDRVLDGDLAPGDSVQKLVADVVSALPALVMSYRKEQGLDQELARDLTNQCFRMARTGGIDLAEDLPQANDVMGAQAAVAQPEAVSETLSH
jgi:chemotaxis protein histidine kinase CheA